MDSKDVANPLSPIYSRSVPARSSCAPCSLASPQPRHYARQVIQSTVRLAQSTATPRWLHPHQWRRGQIAIEPSALLLLHLTRFLPLALFVRLRSARVDGVVVQASEKLHMNGIPVEVLIGPLGPQLTDRLQRRRRPPRVKCSRTRTSNIRVGVLFRSS